MKKYLAFLLALAMVAAMAPVAFAEVPSEVDETFEGLNHGYVYVQDEDDDYYTEERDYLAPGETGWVFIGEYDGSDDLLKEEPRSIKIESQEMYGEDYDDDAKLITVTKTAEKKKVANRTYGWFAKIKAKDVKMSSYPEDGYEVTELVLEYRWEDFEGYIDVELDYIKYEDADDELDEDPKLFSYEKEDDVDIMLPDDDGSFTGVARKDFDIIASMDTKVNNSLINKYPNADFRFYNGNGAKFPVSKGQLIINGESNEYCYEVRSNGDYVDLTDNYDSKEKGFVISTTTLGKYVVSDIPLSGAAAPETVVTPDPTPSAPTTTYPVTSPVISNPNTGVWEG